jgi:glycosyltransferase involved in cell wall biosynthesis
VTQRSACEHPSELSLMIVTPYVPPHLGGVETYVLNLARELVRQHGVKVVLAATAAKDVDVSNTEKLFAGVDGLQLRWLPAFAKVSNTPIGVGWARRLRQLAREEKVDLVNAHAPVPFVADIAARACSGLPFVLTYHSGPMRKGRWWIDAGLRAYERWILTDTMGRADAVISASTYVSNSHRPTTAPIREIIHPAIDATLFCPGGAPESEFAVLFVGTLTAATRYKGLETLLNAIRIMRVRGIRARLEVVGDGEDRPRYQRMARELQIDDWVTFAGMRHGHDLVEAYRRNAVLAVPSVFDNFPTVALEAMACGRPVVASDIGALADLVIDGKTGFRVPPADPDALADRLATLLGRGEYLAQLGSEGRRFVLSGATIEAQARHTFEVFRRVLDRRDVDTVRVAVVAPHYPPRVGGVERYVNTVVLALRDSPRHDVIVVTASESRRFVVESQDGITIFRLPTLFTLSDTPIHPFWLVQLRRLLNRLNIDVIHAHAPVPGLADAAAFTGGPRPVVLTYHSGSLVKGIRSVDWFLSRYEKHLLPRVFARCAALGAVSPVSTSYATGRATLVPPGVDTAVFSPASAELRRGPTVLYVGRMDRSSRWKGVDILLRAMVLLRSQLPDVQLDLVGAGDAVPEIQSLARSLGIDQAINWRGVLDGEALVEQYRQAGVVVLPSTTESESFGMVLIEAMACGCPVVGSDVGGIPYVIRSHIDGLLVPPGEPKALADACLSIFEDPAMAAELGKQGRVIAEKRWDWSKRIIPIIDLLDSALNGVQETDSDSHRLDAARRS